MEITITEMLEKVLTDIGSIDGILTSALVSNNGFMMASAINEDTIDAETIGGLVAMLMRSAAHTAKELEKGEIEYLMLDTKEGKIILKKTTSDATLTVLTDTNANVGTTLKIMEKACGDIKNIFAQV